MYCDNCKNLVESDSSSCARCGKALTSPTFFEPKIYKASNYTSKQILLGCFGSVFILAILVFILVAAYVADTFRSPW